MLDIFFSSYVDPEYQRKLFLFYQLSNQNSFYNTTVEQLIKVMVYLQKNENFKDDFFLDQSFGIGLK